MSELSGRLLDGTAVRIRVRGDRIAAVERPTDGVVPDRVVLPGLIDLQVNGYAGFDVNAADVSADVVDGLTRTLWGLGVTGYCPTIVTASADRMLAAIHAITAARERDPAVAHTIVGIHLEGPYLAPDDGPRGAHDPAYLRDPDPAELETWLTAAPGLIRLITLAPERAGAEDYIRTATAAGVVVAIGHTAASPDQVRAAVRAGARMSTHLGNGTFAVLPRHPNAVWAQLAEDGLTASFIADGQHLPADTFTAMVRAKGPGRSVLVSDSVALAGSVPGEYTTPVGGSVTVDPDGRLRLTGTDLLAGSGSSLLDCVRWARTSTPIDVETLWAMASSTPAGLLGLADRGTLRAGSVADLVIADVLDAGRIAPETVMVRGAVVVQPSVEGVHQ